LSVSQVQPDPLIDTMPMPGSTTSVRVTGVVPSVGLLPELVTVSV